MKNNNFSTARTWILAVTGPILLAVLIGAPQTAVAETQAQMRARVAAELIAKQPIVNSCDAPCLENWITADHRLPADKQFLRPLAERIGLPLDVVARANIAYTIEWGFAFERLYGRPPTADDWIYGYADRNEAYRALFNVSPDLYRVNRWAEFKDAQLKREYGGAW